MTEKEMIDVYGKFTTYYQKWHIQRSKMPMVQLKELKVMLLEIIKIDYAYGSTAVQVDRDIMLKEMD